MRSPKAIERICRIKGIKVEKSNFSFLFSDLSHLSEFTKPVETSIFKIMKKALPGPFTFILNASNNIPKMFNSKKRKIGIRVPKNEICKQILLKLGNPLLNTSIHDEDDDIIEYMNNPDDIYKKYHKLVDIVIDGGNGNIFPSTVVDCSGGTVEIIRQGIGIIEGY